MLCEADLGLCRVLLSRPTHVEEPLPYYLSFRIRGDLLIVFLMVSVECNGLVMARRRRRCCRRRLGRKELPILHR